MYQETTYLSIIPEQKKCHAETPQTADSQLIHANNKEGKSFAQHQQLWCFLDNQICVLEKSKSDVQLHLKKGLIVEERKMIEAQNKELVKIEASFRIVLEVLTPDALIIKKLIKKIDTIFENEEEITCIFDHQHENFVFPDQKILLQASLQTNQGFIRSFWKEEITEFVKLTDETTFLTSQDSRFQLSLLKESKKWNIGKPLCIKMPISIIDNVIDEKLKLLNKSEILNDVKSLINLKGILYELSKQNMGSRIIQKLLCLANQQEIAIVFMELRPLLSKLVLDKYGNYIFQKLFEIGSIVQRKQLLQHLQPNIQELIQSKSGTYTFQIIFKKIKSTEEFTYFLEIIRPHLINLCLNQFGNHFVKEMLAAVFDETINYLMLQNFELLATNKHGIVPLKAFIKMAVKQPMMRSQVISYGQYYFNSLAVDEYGHYIIEQLYHYYGSAELVQIFDHLQNYIVFFGQNQYSSSILKKGLEKFKEHLGVPIANSLLNEGLQTLMESNPGSFTLHRLMDNLGNTAQKNMLTNQMKVISGSLNSYEKRIKWQKFFNLV